MGNSNGGSLDNTTYTFRYFSQQSPVLLNYLARKNNVAAAPVDAPFSYLDLGCGNGVSLNTLAAASPHSSFFGVDLMPDHIANARAMAGVGQLSNVTFIEAAFADLADHDLPQFDYITLHGVYSWISAEERHDIRRAIIRLLKPNGIVYVSYNALPGQAALSPLRDLFKNYAASIPGNPAQRAARGIKFLDYLKLNKARYIEENPLVGAVIGDMHNRDIAYIAHEYLTDDYTAFSVETVAVEMAEQSLVFCCGMPQRAAWLRRNQLRKFQALLNSKPAGLEREALTSILLNESFRADIYCRAGHDRIDGTSTTTFLASVFGAANLLPQTQPASRNLNKEASNVLQAFSPGSSKLETVSQMSSLKTCTTERLGEFVHYLVEDHYLQPFAHPTTPAVVANPNIDHQRYQISTPFNRSVLKNHLATNGRCSLASPVVGDGISVDLITGLFLLALTEIPDEDPVSHVDQALKDTGREWRRNKVVVSDPAERIAVLTEDLADFRNRRLPMLLQLGIVEMV